MNKVKKIIGEMLKKVHLKQFEQLKKKKKLIGSMKSSKKLTYVYNMLFM